MEFRRLEEENASAPAGDRLTEEEMLIDPEYDEMLKRQGEELCEEVGIFPRCGRRFRRNIQSVSVPLELQREMKHL